MSEMDTIAIDFDGVIHKYSKGWHDGTIYDEPVEGVVEALIELAEDFKLVVFTARQDLGAVVDYIDKLKVPVFDVTNVKPPAFAYVDDRGIRFTTWPAALKMIHSLRSGTEK